MGIAEEFEKRLEKMVEGVFSKAFRSDVEPSEIGRRLLREMEGGKSISVSAVYVPNVYVIGLPPADFQRFEGLMSNLKTEFAGLLKANAAQRRWRPAGPLDIRFEQDDQIAEGKFQVQALHEQADEPMAAPATIALVGSEQSQVWSLDQPRLTLGRASTNEIMVADPNASREHARLEERDGSWWLVDLGSTNGTLVNETLIKERRLTPGDRITIGAAILEFREEGE
ncbi:MAG: FhaA domain-containing protein [Actinomycetota bacterium]